MDLEHCDFFHCGAYLYIFLQLIFLLWGILFIMLMFSLSIIFKNLYSKIEPYGFQRFLYVYVRIMFGYI